MLKSQALVLLHFWIGNDIAYACRSAFQGGLATTILQTRLSC